MRLDRLAIAPLFCAPSARFIEWVHKMANRLAASASSSPSLCKLEAINLDTEDSRMLSDGLAVSNCHSIRTLSTWNFGVQDNKNDQKTSNRTGTIPEAFIVSLWLGEDFPNILIRIRVAE